MGPDHVSSRLGWQ